MGKGVYQCCMNCIRQDKGDLKNPCKKCTRSWLRGKGLSEFQPTDKAIEEANEI